MAIEINGKKVAGVGRPGKDAEFPIGSAGQLLGYETDGNTPVAMDVPVPDVGAQIEAHDVDGDAHGDIREAISAATSAAANAQATADSKASMEEVNEAIAAIPEPDMSAAIETHDVNGEAHSDIRQLVSNAASAADAAQAAANSKAPAIRWGTTEVTAGAASTYPEGTLYVVIE